MRQCGGGLPPCPSGAGCDAQHEKPKKQVHENCKGCRSGDHPDSDEDDPAPTAHERWCSAAGLLRRSLKLALSARMPVERRTSNSAGAPKSRTGLWTPTGALVEIGGDREWGYGMR